ncbi:sensor domain-containing protein [Modestobacter sp. NPDC049651]|uniref:sensor histidine kinase n=1 Tax=unclassified Modestobacter TaxID=2643866 RepID=UPI0033C90C33
MQIERPPARRARPAPTRVLGRALQAIEQLAGGLGTAALALLVLLWTAVAGLLCAVGVGLALLPGALQSVRWTADRERTRLGRWGEPVVVSGPLPAGLRAALADPALRAELRWLPAHATAGLVLGLLGVVLPIYAVQYLTYPLWWQALPEGDASPSPGLWAVDGWTDAIAVMLLGLGWAVITLGATPVLARWQGRLGRRLLAPPPGTDLTLRVAELTATRAAALDAHVTELRRIERALHDGTQNRLVAVSVLLGAARRTLERDPAAADEVLERAQSAAEQALAELRAVARGILPPALADRGLAGALAGLAAGSPVPCRVDVVAPVRCAASVEATAWFVVAEALTNVARHSGATAASVTVRQAGGRLTVEVADDGHGGADETAGSGISGIRRRVAAHDGDLTLTSPPGGPTTLRVELPCG